MHWMAARNICNQCELKRLLTAVALLVLARR